MNVKNYVRFEFLSLAENISFARSCVGAFASQMDCTLDDIEEIKLVVSEAVSNSIIHAYDKEDTQRIEIMVSIMEMGILEIIVKDYGKGIEDIKQALKPAYSTDPGRMGLGFTFMKSFMDELEIISQPGEGTSVRLIRNFLARAEKAHA
jgi:stage II sporulation protein AB (anti-sigma F factor)